MALMYLSLSSDMAVTQQPWDEWSLPTDTIPTLTAISLFPDMLLGTYTGNVTIDITLTVEKRFIWLHSRGHAIYLDEVIFMTSSMQEVAINSTFVHTNGFFVVELKNTIMPGNYKLQIHYDGMYDPRNSPYESFLFYKTRNITR